MNGFDVINFLLLYIKKEETTEYRGTAIVQGWGGPALFREGAENQKKHGWLAEQQAPFNCFYHA